MPARSAEIARIVTGNRLRSSALLGGVGSRLDRSTCGLVSHVVNFGFPMGFVRGSISIDQARCALAHSGISSEASIYVRVPSTS